jgi:hypothetical protein
MDAERERLAELKAKVDGLCAAFEDFRTQTRAWQQELRSDLLKQLHQHGERLRTLEQWRSWLAGGLAMLGLLWAAVWTWMKR